MISKAGSCFLKEGKRGGIDVNTIFNVGIYVRLSREDERSIESESIINQKDYLTRYVLEQGWSLVEIFADDGYSGTNFNRPDFNRMLTYIESKKINLVITKDLSRLGRDYIDTGYYLERYFPERGIRYIALNDGIDTFESNSNNDMSPFKSVMNDFYARDISKKVRSTINQKRKNGEFIGAFAPYGYRKDPQNKNKLVIDQTTAHIVRKIFNLFVNGTSLMKIAFILNDENIPSPRAYKKQISNYKGRDGKLDIWSFETIKYILTNPTYSGNVTQNRYTKINYKTEKLKKVPRESWITVHHTHEAIIDSETFQHVQEIFGIRDYESKYTAKEGMKHLLSGMIFCGDCGSRMTFITSGAKLVYAICSRYKNHKMCTRHSIPEKELEWSVIEQLKKITGYASDYQRLLSIAQKYTIHSIDDNQMNLEIVSINARIDEIKKTLKNLYEDKLKGIVSEIDFIDFSHEYNSEREKLMFRLGKLQKEQKGIQQEEQTEKLIKLVKKFADFTNVNKPMLIKLIKKIEIFEQRNITVYYKFPQPL